MRTHLSRRVFVFAVDIIDRLVVIIAEYVVAYVFVCLFICVTVC